MLSDHPPGCVLQKAAFSLQCHKKDGAAAENGLSATSHLEAAANDQGPQRNKLESTQHVEADSDGM